MAALNTTDRTLRKDRWKKITERCLFIVAVVTWFAVFRGLTSIEEMSGNGFVARAGATIIATGMAVGVYLFWTYLYEIWPAMKTRGAKLRVAAAATVGLAVIVCASTHLSVTGIAGAEAQAMALDDSIAAFEKAAADRADSLTALGGYVTSLSGTAKKFEDLAQAEFERGSISGAVARSSSATNAAAARTKPGCAADSARSAARRVAALCTRLSDAPPPPSPICGSRWKSTRAKARPSSNPCDRICSPCARSRAAMPQ